MFYRVRQFFRGLLSYNYGEYEEFINTYLNNGEKELFYKLPNHEKRHCVDTAKTLLGFNPAQNSRLLVKAALLHDIGKITGKAGIIKKSILVLMDAFFPKASHKLSKRINMFNMYYNHPEIGAKLLRNTNTEKQVVLLVEFHHCQDKVNDIAGMDLLKKADSLN